MKTRPPSPGATPVPHSSSFIDKDQQVMTSRPEEEGNASCSPSEGRAAYPHASQRGEAIRQEWDSINRKDLGLPPELASALEALPALKAMCHDLIKNGWKIRFGPENQGSHTNDDKKEIIIDSKRKAVRAALLTTAGHEVQHAKYNWSGLMQRRLQNLLLGQKISEGEYILSCAKNEGHSMFAEFQLLAMCENDLALQQEIEDYLKEKYGSREGTANTGVAYQKGMMFYRQWHASPNDDAKEPVIHQASDELGRLFADLIGGQSKRPYKEAWKADFAKTPQSRRPQLISWMLPQTAENRSPRRVTIYTENFERTLAGYSDPQKAREMVTHAVRGVVPHISKDEKEADIWNVAHTFLLKDQEYKVCYQYDFWLDSVSSQKFQIEGLSKS